MEFTTTTKINIREYFDNLYEIFDENLVCNYEYTIFEKGYEDFEDLIEWCKSMNIDPYAQDKNDRFILLIWFNSFLF
jgi:hypothetical protein